MDGWVFFDLWIAVFWFFNLAVCVHVGQRRNAAGQCFFVGLLFGPLGLLLALAMDYREDCPACYTRLNGPVHFCPGCRCAIRWEKRKNALGFSETVAIAMPPGQSPPALPPRG